jgi:hypothetical protein
MACSNPSEATSPPQPVDRRRIHAGLLDRQRRKMPAPDCSAGVVASALANAESSSPRR